MTSLFAAADYVHISWGQLAAALALVAVNLVLSVLLQLGLARRLLVATVRMCAQLLLIGLVLEWVFDQQHPVVILAMCALMAGIAGVSAVRRTDQRFAGIWWNSLVAIMGCSFAVTGLSVAGILQVQPWFTPQYLIPMLGMVLGNSLNGISLGLDRFMRDLRDKRDAIEALLCLGATRREAAAEAIRHGVRTGMVPTVNTMLVMGVVSLPGMMTGQILGGADPADAVRYQIVIMCMIASSTALATWLVISLAARHLFDEQHRLRLDRLRELPSTR